MEKRKYDIKSIQIGAVPEDGVTEPTSYTEIGKNIVVDSMTGDQEDNTYIKPVNQEDKSIDAVLLETEGSKTITFQSRDMSFDNLIRVLGGSVVSGVYNAPIDTFTGTEVCLRIETAEIKGVSQVTFYPRVKMTGKVNDIFSASEMANVQFDFDILQASDETDPLSPKTSPMFVSWYPGTPTNGVVDDTAKSFSFSFVNNFPTADAYEYSIDGGTAWVDATVNPIVGITGVVAAGDLLVRVAEDLTKNLQAGDSLASTDGFTA